MTELKEMFKNYSAEEISKMIGMSVFTVYKWKSGETVPSPLAQRAIRGVYRHLKSKKKTV